MTTKTAITLSDDHIKILQYLKENKEIGPLKAGELLGHDYYSASSRGHYVLYQLLLMGRIKNDKGKYSLK